MKVKNNTASIVKVVEILKETTLASGGEVEIDPKTTIVVIGQPTA